MSASSELYGSYMTLKVMEKRKMPSDARISGSVHCPDTFAGGFCGGAMNGVRMRKKTQSGTKATMKGLRRPRRVQMRSLSAPTAGWITDPSSERVLASTPINTSDAPNVLR
jgi:hypothetical protein